MHVAYGRSGLCGVVVLHFAHDRLDWPIYTVGRTGLNGGCLHRLDKVRPWSGLP